MVNVTLPVPRIEIVGNEFRRLGERWKGWGFQQLSGQFKKDFLDSTDMNDYLHETMKNTLSGDHAQGANLIRLHLDLWDILDVNSPDENTITVNETVMTNLIFFLYWASQNNMYVLLCGCNQTFITPGMMPSWYDDNFGDADPKDRWDVQERFWTEVSSRIVAANLSSTILYDLMNEPLVTANSTAPWTWLPDTAGAHFNTVIARGVSGVNAEPYVTAWITQLRDAIKAQDPKALVTFGSMGILGAYNGAMGLNATEPLLDFVQCHLYPDAFNSPDTPEVLAPMLEKVRLWGLATKPILCGEFAPWANGGNTGTNNVAFFDAIQTHIPGGVIGFSNGYGPDQYPPVNYLPAKYPAPNDDDGLLGPAWFNNYFWRTWLEFMAAHKDEYLSAP